METTGNRSTHTHTNFSVDQLNLIPSRVENGGNVNEKLEPTNWLKLNSLWAGNKIYSIKNVNRFSSLNSRRLSFSLSLSIAHFHVDIVVKVYAKLYTHYVCVCVCMHIWMCICIWLIFCHFFTWQNGKIKANNASYMAHSVGWNPVAASLLRVATVYTKHIYKYILVFFVVVHTQLVSKAIYSYICICIGFRGFYAMTLLYIYSSSTRLICIFPFQIHHLNGMRRFFCPFR